MIVLTSEEVADLTDCKQPMRQIEWLTQRGWRFEVGASGRPKIARSYFESRLGQPEKQKKYRVREIVE